MSKIMINISLIKYLKDYEKFYGECFITKGKGGHVYISNETPGDFSEAGKIYINHKGDKVKESINYIEFDDSDFYQKLPKEIHQYFNMQNGSYKTVKEIIKEIKHIENE